MLLQAVYFTGYHLIRITLHTDCSFKLVGDQDVYLFPHNTMHKSGKL